MYAATGQQQAPQQQPPQQDLSVVLVTGSYDHEIRFWEAWSGICSRTIARSGETGVSVFPILTYEALIKLWIYFFFVALRLVWQPVCLSDGIVLFQQVNRIAISPE